MGAVLRITGGNLRLVCRLIAQMDRLRDINELSKVNIEFVEASLDDLVIGAT